MKNNKAENLREKLKQALTSTARVISDDIHLKTIDEKNKKDLNFVDIENLNSKGDFIKARAESDSSALKKKFSNDEIYKKNLPLNSSYKSLYSIAEKVRYECLGSEMLKGIAKNLKENYDQIIQLKRKDQLNSKEDVPVVEAFELYMLKKFLNVELNDLTNNMLNFWEKDFDKVMNKHIEFLKENLEYQNEYSSKFSEILQEMDIFKNEDNEETREENQDDGQNNPSNDDQDNNSDDSRDENDNEETEASLDSEYDIDEYKLDEQLIDSETDQKNNEQVIQKKSINDLNTDYKIFTTQFDEITKAENLENSDEASKLRKTLDQQLIGFQDVITKLANKLQRQLFEIFVKLITCG